LAFVAPWYATLLYSTHRTRPWRTGARRAHRRLREPAAMYAIPTGAVVSVEPRSPPSRRSRAAMLVDASPVGCCPPPPWENLAACTKEPRSIMHWCRGGWRGGFSSSVTQSIHGQNSESPLQRHCLAMAWTGAQNFLTIDSSHFTRHTRNFLSLCTNRGNRQKPSTTTAQKQSRGQQADRMMERHAVLTRVRPRKLGVV